MNENMMFENGGFSGDWTEYSPRKAPPEPVPMRQSKDLDTLLRELDEIKEKIEDIKAREWHLAKLMNFYRNGFAAE